MSDELRCKLLLRLSVLCLLGAAECRWAVFMYFRPWSRNIGVPLSRRLTRTTFALSSLLLRVGFALQDTALRNTRARNSATAPTPDSPPENTD